MKRSLIDSEQKSQPQVIPDKKKNGKSLPRRLKSTTVSHTFTESSEFLCDSKISFNESGDSYDIVTVELAEKSKYFERLLYYEGFKPVIVLPEFLNSCFSSIIEFIRLGQTEITEANIYDLFIASDYLLLEDLKKSCSNYIIELADRTPIAINIWLSCRHLCWPELGDMAFFKVVAHFDTIWNTQEFLNLPENDIIQILSHACLNSRHEMDVFKAIIRWLTYKKSKKKRHQYTDQLLSCIRFGLLTLEDINKIDEHPLISSNENAQSLIATWRQSLQNSSFRSTISSHNTPRTTHKILLVFGGWCNVKGPRAAVQVYDPRANQWTLWSDQTSSQDDFIDTFNNNQSSASTLASTVTSGDTISTSVYIPPYSTDVPLSSASKCIVDSREEYYHKLGSIPKRVYAGCTIVDNRIYLIGGYEGTQVLKSTLCYDLGEINHGSENKSACWQIIGCMYERRHYVTVAAAKGYIYALGGHNGEPQGRLATAERFKIADNLWQIIAPMCHVRSDASAAELDEHIYVAGGFQGRKYHDTVEVYNADEDQWTVLDSKMISPRGGLSIARVGWSLYAIGGNDGTCRLQTIERFDLSTGKWELVGNMARGKSNLSCSVIDSDIFILGGWSDEKDMGILGLVERFDTVTGRCDVVNNMAFAASATCACTLFGDDIVKHYVRRRLPCTAGSKGMPQVVKIDKIESTNTNSESIISTGNSGNVDKSDNALSNDTSIGSSNNN